MPRIVLAESATIDFPMDQVAHYHAALDGAETSEAADAVTRGLAERLLADRDDIPAGSARAGLAEELGRALRFLRPVPRDQFAARINVCRGCEHASQYASGIDGLRMVLRCGQCGCIMNLKARMASGRCPLGKFT